MLRPQPAVTCRPGSALPLSYRRMGRRTGFEPATSRFADEVTAIFTTDRGGGWRGTSDAVAALAGGRARTRSAPWRLTEVTDIFTTALPMRASAIEGHAGEQAISASVTATPALPCGTNRSRGARQPSPATSTVRDVKGGIRTRSFHGAKYPTSSPPASVEPRDGGKPRYKIYSARRLERRAAIANPLGFALPSVSGLRLVPSDRPRALGTRHPARAPGSGSPVPACAGMLQTSRASDNKKPSGAFGSGGFVASGPISVRLREIAPMSRACAIDWRGAIR